MIKEIIHDTISEKSEIEKQRKGYCTMKIYEKIFARLEELHMSQTELSRRMGTILGMICQVSIADQNIHIVSKEQMRKRKRMLYKEFLK